MKKITLSVALTLVALWLVPQSMKADCDFTPNLFPGQAEDRTELEISATVKVGEGGTGRSQYGEITNLATTNPDVVSIYNTGLSGVFFVGAGEADVTYTEVISGYVGREWQVICSTDHTIHYTVEKGVPDAYFPGLYGSPATKLSVAYSQGGGGGDASGGGVGTGADGGVSTGGEGGGGAVAPSVPSPHMYYKELGGIRVPEFVDSPIPSAEITYTSSNKAVATISESGSITVLGLGKTTLSASWPGNANWEAANPTLELTVVEQTATIYFSPGNITDSVGKVIPLHVEAPEGVTITRWSSSNENVATVDDEGNATLKLPGSVYIYAEFDGNEQYGASRCACMITVRKAYPRITFTPSVIKLEKNVDVFEAPVMNKPADLTETYKSTYEWSAYDPYGVASVNDQTGEITLLGGTGTATIIYAFKGDAKYLAENARYYIEVTTSGITIMGHYATTANDGDVLGDGSVIYTTNNGDKNLTLNNIDYDAKGGIFLQSTSSSNLNIYVKGNCRVTNAAKGMEIQGPLYIWCENKKDSIFLEASNTALHAAGMKVIDCYLFATGGLYGIYTNDMAVWAGGYIFAHGTTEAIHTNRFTKGEASIGGIEALTKGVVFVEGNGKNPGGFFTDYEHGVYAHDVQIGKVPLPVSNEETKDINFDSENPYDNLDVVFSESEDDTFNEDDSQIEINTTTDSETLKNTLALHVTCSSEWLKALPGVLVFDVPAGEGKFGIQCEVAAGFHAEAYIEGIGEANLDAPKDGWIEVNYSVAQQTHVIIYLQADKDEKTAPARVAKAKKDANPGLAIKAIKITPKDAPTAIDTTPFPSGEGRGEASKLLHEGQLLIIRNGQTYTVTGQAVK